MSTDERFNKLIANQLKAGLTGAGIIGREIIVLEETASTNDAILQIAAPQAAALYNPGYVVPEGLVVFAEHQTDGRGQHGNCWESAAWKGLWFSIL
jgi:hypothetical protein